MTLEMHCIRNIKLFLEVAELLEYPREKVMLVLNKASNRTNIRAEEVEKNIQRKIQLQICDAGQDMTFAINQGVPLIIARPTHQAARDIGILAREVTLATKAAAPGGSGPAEAPAPKSGGLFTRLIKR
jgi:pilus assembly protein CpaE